MVFTLYATIKMMHGPINIRCIRNISESVSGASLLVHGLIRRLASLIRVCSVSSTAYADVRDGVSLSLSLSLYCYYYIPLPQTNNSMSVT